ncbi:MAG: hypothetical protein JSW40_00085 [Candidatus Omnitrophota bacterium]|nr:MAG: hypothetical protein JSW40_00085 [Candidatus Omnitrophota bacterium]
MRKLLFHCCAIVICTSAFVGFLSDSVFCEEENLTFTTFYPSSRGVYRRLVLGTLGVGDNVVDTRIRRNDAPDPSTNPGEVWIAGTMGIGTNTPQGKLAVSGGAVIGSGYAGARTAPSNGLLVEGGVSVELARSPYTDLEIANVLRLRPSSTSVHSVEGALYYDGDEEILKYHNGVSWVPLGGGGGGQIGQCQDLGGGAVGPDCQEVLSGFLRSNGRTSGGNIIVGADVDCPANHVVTGVRLYAVGGCPWSCNHFSGRIRRIGLICTQLQ